MSARRRDRRPTLELECLEDRLALSSADAPPEPIFGQIISQSSQYLNTLPNNGQDFLESLGYANRGDLYSELAQVYHERT
jgi:hypothetical protein